MKNLIKSRNRVRDHGEVFTPDFVVNDMLDLVKNETENIESRFLEPACGDGNFLIKVLERKLKVVKRVYKKSQFDYEKNALLAISSLYGVDLLYDNVKEARDRLYSFFLNEYKELYKEKINNNFLKSIKYVLSRNILQGNALTLKDNRENLIIFSEWSSVKGVKIKRRDFSFANILSTEAMRVGLFKNLDEESLSSKPIKEYPPTSFLKLYIVHE